MITGGTLVMTAAGVQRGLTRTADRVEDARRYQLEVRTAAPLDDAQVAAVRAAPGVRAVEAWAVTPASRGPVARTHPDGGHGAFVLAAPPADGTTLARFPLRAGRWLTPGDDDAVLLSDGGAPIGSRVELTVGGRVTTWTVVGVVDEVAGRSAFVTPAAFRRVTGQAGPNLLRIAADPGALAGVERALAGVPVDYALPIRGLHSIIADHVAMVVRAVVALAAVVAAVGLLGLAIAMGVSVAERTGELGVMKALGASDRRLAALVIGEAVAIGAVAVIVALLLTPLVTAAVVDRVTVIGHPPFALSAPAMIAWPLAALVGSGGQPGARPPRRPHVRARRARGGLTAAPVTGRVRRILAPAIAAGET